MSGKLYPNTTQVPNVFFKKIMPELPAAPLKVFLAIVRFTYGFQKASDKIGNKQLTKATGLSRSSVIRGVQVLGDLITVKQGGPTKGANEYSINMDVSDAMIESLKHRITALGSSVHDTSSASETSSAHATQVVAPVSPFQTNSSKPSNAVSKDRSRNTPKDTNPRVREFIGWFAAEFQTRRGRPYHVVGKIHGTLVKALLTTFDLPTLKRCAVALFESDDTFLSNTDRGIGILSNQINKLAGMINQDARGPLDAAKPERLDYDGSGAHA